jgi:4-hydroxybenzoate polyprenyltransferase
VIRNVIYSLRPKQWSKNILIFAAIIFTGNLTDAGLLTRSAAAFIIFCGLSGVIYLINDIIDKDRDRKHPTNKERPIAKGTLDEKTAIAAAIVISAVCLPASLILSKNFFFCAVTYLVLLFSYSIILKNFAIVDVLTVSMGFVLRLIAGGLAIGIVSSPWSAVMTFFLAVFVSFSKRRTERQLFGDIAAAYRSNLRHYHKETLDYIVIVSATTVIISYVLFTLLSGKNPYLYVTVPFVIYGVFRYMFLTFEKNLGAEPANLFMSDKPLFASVALWAIISTILIYT